MPACLGGGGKRSYLGCALRITAAQISAGAALRSICKLHLSIYRTFKIDGIKAR